MLYLLLDERGLCREVVNDCLLLHNVEQRRRPRTGQVEAAATPVTLNVGPLE
jgi:hypothetical protein